MKLHEVLIDNKNGAGAVPYNVDIDYFGVRVQMTPAQFARLAPALGSEPTQAKARMKQHLQAGGAIGSPFLMIELPKQYLKGDVSQPATIVGHEGRHRMSTIAELEGSTTPVEVHLLFPGLRNRHITPAILQALNAHLIPEHQKAPVKGPFFTVMQKGQ